VRINRPLGVEHHPGRRLVVGILAEGVQADHDADMPVTRILGRGRSKHGRAPIVVLDQCLALLQAHDQLVSGRDLSRPLRRELATQPVLTLRFRVYGRLALLRDLVGLI
jgi:hypothetical protein